jgi:hypothetical protein
MSSGFLKMSCKYIAPVPILRLPKVLLAFLALWKISPFSAGCCYRDFWLYQNKFSPGSEGRCGLTDTSSWLAYCLLTHYLAGLALPCKQQSFETVFSLPFRQKKAKSHASLADYPAFITLVCLVVDLVYCCSRPVVEISI